MEQIMAVLGQEGNYADRLCDYANQRKNIPFKAVPFHDCQSYLRFADSHRIVLLLAEPELIAGEYDLHADRVLSLCETEIRPEESSFLSGCDGEIYKYQSGENILRKALQAAGALDDSFHRQGIRLSTRIVSVYSPIGRCYKTSFALLYAAVRARTERVLFLTFEDFSGLSAILSETFHGGLSDVFYHLKQGNLDAARIGTLLHRFHGVDYIPPYLSAEDSETADADDCTCLLETLMQETGYDLFVIDAGHYSAAAAALLEMSSAVYMPVLDDPVSLAKCSAFEMLLTASGNHRLSESIRKLRLPVPVVAPSGGTYLDRLLLSEFGDYVRGIAG